MNKKIIITTLFAIFMLILPMTSVVSVSDVEDDCRYQVREDFCNAILDIADYLNQLAHKFLYKGSIFFMFLVIEE